MLGVAVDHLITEPVLLLLLQAQAARVVAEQVALITLMAQTVVQEQVAEVAADLEVVRQ
jgi:hypothetical protein